MSYLEKWLKVPGNSALLETARFELIREDLHWRRKEAKKKRRRQHQKRKQ